MDRRAFIGRLVGALLAAPLAAEAQPAGKAYRIGYLGSTPLTAPELVPIWTAFVDTLRERGWVEGQNIVFERRYAQGRVERFEELAVELIRLRVDVLIAASHPVQHVDGRRTYRLVEPRAVRAVTGSVLLRDTSVVLSPLLTALRLRSITWGARKPLHAPDNLSKEAACQVAFGELQREVPGMPDQTPAGLEHELFETRKGPALDSDGQDEPTQQIAEVVGDHPQRAAHLVGSEPMAHSDNGPAARGWVGHGAARADP